MTLNSAEPYQGQDVEGMVKSAGVSAEPPEFQQGERKTLLHGFYDRLVFCNGEVVKCAVLKEMNLTARKLLSHKGSDTTLKALKKTTPRSREELERKNAELKTKLRR